MTAPTVGIKPGPQPNPYEEDSMKMKKRYDVESFDDDDGGFTLAEAREEATRRAVKSPGSQFVIWQLVEVVDVQVSAKNVRVREVR